MRKIFWSPRAQNDYSAIINYLLQRWSIKEVQQFVRQMEDTIHLLKIGNVEFRKTRNRKLHVAVISEQISVYYRIHSKGTVEIVRVWDTRQTPSKL